MVNVVRWSPSDIMYPSMLATKLLAVHSVSVFAPARRHHALLPETTAFDWSPSSGASLAMLDRAIVELGSAENAAPLENVVRSRTVLSDWRVRRLHLQHRSEHETRPD